MSDADNYRVVTSDAEAVALGFPNLASYRHAMSMEIAAAKRRRSAELYGNHQRRLASQLQHQPGAGALAAQSVDPLQKRAFMIQTGQWPENCPLHGPGSEEKK